MSKLHPDYRVHVFSRYEYPTRVICNGPVWSHSIDHANALSYLKRKVRSRTLGPIESRHTKTQWRFFERKMTA